MRFLLAAATLVMAAVLPVHGDELPAVTVEYSADSLVEAEGMSMRTRVYHATGKERREITMEGQRQVMILRMDKGVSWMLVPNSRQYMEMPFGVGPESSGDLAGYDIQRTAVGKERVNGLDTTKYQIALDSPEGVRFNGFMWSTEQGVVVKMEASAAGERAHMRMELSNIRIGPQDAQLFEIPDGYTRLNLEGFDPALQQR